MRLLHLQNTGSKKIAPGIDLKTRIPEAFLLLFTHLSYCLNKPGYHFKTTPTGPTDPPLSDVTRMDRLAGAGVITFDLVLKVQTACPGVCTNGGVANVNTSTFAWLKTCAVNFAVLFVPFIVKVQEPSLTL